MSAHVVTDQIAEIVGLQDALDARAPLVSPSFAGTPLTTQPTPGDSSFQIPTTSWVFDAIAAGFAALVGASPESLDTLFELAAAIGDDPNFATTMLNALAGKQPLSATLTLWASLTPAADRLPYFSATNTAGLVQFPAYGRSVVACSNATALQTLLELGAAALKGVGTSSNDVAAGNRGLPAGGDAGMILRKVDATNYNTGWGSEYARRQARGDFYASVINWTAPTDFASGTGTGGASSAGGTLALLKPGRSYTKGTTAGGANGLIIAGSIYGTSNLGLEFASFSSIETGIHLRIPVLSGGSDTFQVVFGLTNRANTTDVAWNTPGAYCRITGSTLDFITHNGVSGTTVTWGTSIVAGNAYGLFIVWTPASVLFYADNVLAATITTNIPTSGNIRCEAGILGLTGTTAMVINVARPGFYAPYTDAPA